jgi:N-acetyl-gamma-glutamyl-phosphate reductase
MGNAKTKAGIVGASGFSGRELLRLLLGHPQVEVVYAAANDTKRPVAEIWPEFAGKTDLACETYDAARAAQADVVFLATPHTVSMKLAPELLEKGARVIDLSGDFRLESEAEYIKWYKADEHDAPHLLDDAVYGLPEVYARQIKDAKLIANPGCYPTASILSVAPLARKGIVSVHIDAKSGYSGAGIANAEALAKATKDNFKAYKILQHQHSPEIVEQLSFLAGKPLDVAFVPHLLPFERGIFATVYITLHEGLAQADAQALYEDFYKDAAFVQVAPADEDIELRDIVGTNNLKLHVAADPKQKLVVATAVVDNLIKGASGQAVQNLNLMYGYGETAGLK